MTKNPVNSGLLIPRLYPNQYFRGYSSDLGMNIIGKVIKMYCGDPIVVLTPDPENNPEEFYKRISERNKFRITFLTNKRKNISVVKNLQIINTYDHKVVTLTQYPMGLHPKIFNQLCERQPLKQDSYNEAKV